MRRDQRRDLPKPRSSGYTVVPVSPAVGGTREIRHHSQSGEEEAEKGREDEEEKSVIDEEKLVRRIIIPFRASSKDYQAEEDSIDTTSYV